MKEEYLKIAECFENLAKSYRTLAEACIFSADLSKAEDMTGGLAEDSAKAEQNTEEGKSEEKAVTFEDVSTLAKKKASEGNSNAIKEIIKSYNVAKLSAIPEECLSEVFRKLEEL